MQPASHREELKGEATQWKNEKPFTHKNPMQPASHRDSHTRPDLAQTQHTTSIATKSAPYTRLIDITTSALALQSQHRNANLAPAKKFTLCYTEKSV